MAVNGLKRVGKFDEVRRTIRKKKLRLHLRYTIIIVVISILSGYVVGHKQEELKQNELHQLGKKYYHDVSILNKKITYYKNKCIFLDSIPIRYPIYGNIKINSKFGYRSSPFDSTSSFHSGVDIVVSYNKPIMSTGTGTVLYSGYTNTYGNHVIVTHNLGFSTLYAHLNKLNVKISNRVNVGDTIGFAGTTGRSTGVHLHYEVMLYKTKIDPSKYLIYKQ